MTNAKPAQKIEWIAIDRITIVNPRSRDKRVFKEIVDNIAKIGLKRPITVTRRIESDGPYYDLVCGQGRLEAYLQLGQIEVPALVVTADTDDCLIASLVENCARRQHNAVDLLQDIGGMCQRGDSLHDIARKTGLSLEYVTGITRLLEQGEQHLLRSVEARRIPLTVAVEIAETDDHGVQRALQEAYDKNLLRGRKLIVAQRVIETRRRYGKGLGRRGGPNAAKVSSAALVRAYQEDTDRKRDMIQRANGARDRLLLITEALRRLRNDEQFVALLEDEGLVTLPESIAQRIAATPPALI